MSDANTATTVPSTAKLARVRQGSIGLIFMLVIQFLFGIIFNLYGSIPASGHSFGLFSNGWLIVHEIMAVALLGAAGQQVARAMGTGSGLARTTSWIGLIGIVLAIGAGISFTRNSANSASLGMAIAFAIALSCYLISVIRLPAE